MHSTFTTHPAARRPDPAFEVAPQFEIDWAGPPAGLLEAVIAGNDDAVWRMYRQSATPDMFHDWLDVFASQLDYELPHPKDKGRGLRWHASLFMVPLVLPAGMRTDLDQDLTLRDAMVFFHSRLQEWFGSTGHVRLFGSPIGYETLCTWTPAFMQQKLQRLVRQAAADARGQPDGSYALLLPPEAPTLAFLVGSVEGMLARPEIPVRPGEEDLRLQASIAARLQLCAPQSAPAPWVGLPSLFSQAMKEGLDVWFEALHQDLGILGWDVTPARDDMMICQLHLDDSAPHTRPVPIRGFHMGAFGHNAPLIQLGRIAPRSRLGDRQHPLLSAMHRDRGPNRPH